MIKSWLCVGSAISNKYDVCVFVSQNVPATQKCFCFVRVGGGPGRDVTSVSGECCTVLPRQIGDGPPVTSNFLIAYRAPQRPTNIC